MGLGLGNTNTSEATRQGAKISTYTTSMLFSDDTYGDNYNIADHNSLSFTDGTNDTSFSISYWVKLSEALSSNNADLVIKFDEWRMYIDKDDSKVRCALVSSGKGNFVEFRAGDSLLANKWYHIVWTNNNADGDGAFPVDGSEAAIYINGESNLAAATETGTYDGMTASSSAARICTNSANVCRGWHAQFSIYSIGLSAAQVKRLYNRGVPTNAMRRHGLYGNTLCHYTFGNHPDDNVARIVNARGGIGNAEQTSANQQAVIVTGSTVRTRVN